MARRARGFWLERRSGIWQLCWTAAGRKHTRSCRTRDRQEAERFAEKFVDELARPQQPPQPTVASVLDAYLYERRDRISYRQMTGEAKRVKELMGWIDISAMRSAHCTAYARKRSSAGVGPGSIRNELMLLRTALRWAQGELLVGQIPKVPLPSSPPPRDRWLTRGEADRLIEAARAPHIKLFIQLALGTSARTGAILELRWVDVDLERSVISFGHRSGGKKRSVVPIGDRLREALATARMAAQTPYVIEFGGSPVKRIKNGFNAALKRSGIAHCTPHDLRRTAGSWMLQAGVPIMVVSRMLGHSTVRVTEGVYAKHDVEWLRDAAKALEG